MPPGIEKKGTNETSLGDTIPTKQQFYLETPKKKKTSEPVEKLLLSFGHSPGEGIRTSSTVSSLSSNSASTYDLPRRRSIDEADDDEDSVETVRPAFPLAVCAPQYFEPAAPPLQDAKHVPSFWSTLFECCHPVLEAEPACTSVPTDGSAMGRFLKVEEFNDWETNEVVARKRGLFRGWKNNRPETSFFATGQS